jgi:hypothetical protein
MVFIVSLHFILCPLWVLHICVHIIVKMSHQDKIFFRTSFYRGLEYKMVSKAIISVLFLCFLAFFAVASQAKTTGKQPRKQVFQY